MKYNILVVDSQQYKHSFIIQLATALVGRDFNFSLLSGKGYLFEQFTQANWPVKLNRKAWPNNTRLSRIFLFYYSLIYFLKLFFYQGEKPKAVLLLSWQDKVVITPLAKLLGWEAIWLEFPGTRYDDLRPCWRKLLQKRAQSAKLIALAKPTKEYLIEQGLANEHLPVIMPGINFDDYVYQDNIFDNLAEGREGAFRENNFTIGTVMEQVDEQKVEMLLKTVQQCLEFIPSVQLIIIGSYTDKKKIDWLVRRMGVQNVWLVSDQVNLKKWLNNFNVFVVAEPIPKLNNLLAAMGAMANRLPVIGQINTCLDDIIMNQQSGLLIDLNSQDLAEQIIELQQDPVKRTLFGKRARALAEAYFSFERASDDFYKLLSKL